MIAYQYFCVQSAGTCKIERDRLEKVLVMHQHWQQANFHVDIAVLAR